MRRFPAVTVMEVGDSSLEPDRKSVGLAMFVVSCVCATLGLMVSACFIIFHVYHRKNKVVRMSSPNLNIVTSVGGVLLSVVCFMYGLEFIFQENITLLAVLCKMRLWVIVVSTSLVLGPVAAKCWRVHEIFKYGLAKKVVIKDGRLFAALGGLVLVDAILMTLWHTIDPVTVARTWYLHKSLEDQSNTSDVTTSSFLIYECTCSKLGIWVGVVSLWKLVLIITCLLYAWKTRTVPVPSLNDSAHILTAILICVLLMFTVALVTVSFRDSPNAVYVSTCVGIAACVIGVQTTLFLPKVKQWWKTPENVSPRISHAPRKSTDENMTSRDVPGDVNGNMYPDDCLWDIVEENKVLKESLLQKEDLISSLQKYLDSAKEKLVRFPTDPTADTNLATGLDGNSVDDIYDTLKAVDSPRDRSKAYRVDLPTRSQYMEGSTHDQTDVKTACTGSLLGEQATRTDSLNYAPSASASSRHSFVEEFTDIRQSLAQELTNATSVNAELRKSLSGDMDRSFSETEWLYERTEPRELAGSIAQSYDLGDNQETITHLKSYLPSENSVFQVRKTRRTSTSSIVSWQSVDNMSSTRSVEPDNISCDVTSVTRDSATPNSLQHAAILRYYSYRHINDGFMRLQHAFKSNADTSDMHTCASKQSSGKPQTEVSAVIAKPPPIPPRQLKPVIVGTKLGFKPKDSFV